MGSRRCRFRRGTGGWSGRGVRSSGFPRLFADAGPKAARHFAEFFAVPIGNKNTRLAYFQAIRQFCDWCEGRGIALAQVEPDVLAALKELVLAA